MASKYDLEESKYKTPEKKNSFQKMLDQYNTERPDDFPIHYLNLRSLRNYDTPDRRASLQEVIDMYNADHPDAPPVHYTDLKRLIQTGTTNITPDSYDSISDEQEDSITDSDQQGSGSESESGQGQGQEQGQDQGLGKYDSDLDEDEPDPIDEWYDEGYSSDEALEREEELIYRRLLIEAPPNPVNRTKYKIGHLLKACEVHQVKERGTSARWETPYTPWTDDQDSDNEEKNEKSSIGSVSSFKL